MCSFVQPEIQITSDFKDGYNVKWFAWWSLYHSGLTAVVMGWSPTQNISVKTQVVVDQLMTIELLTACSHTEGSKPLEASSISLLLQTSQAFIHPNSLIQTGSKHQLRETTRLIKSLHPNETAASAGVSGAHSTSWSDCHHTFSTILQQQLSRTRNRALMNVWWGCHGSYGLKKVLRSTINSWDVWGDDRWLDRGRVWMFDGQQQLYDSWWFL